jgi:TetR/AcrR family transcriptional regulator, mexCD-oprJ operon repressor
VARPEPAPIRRRQALQQRVTEVILEGALQAFARSGDASMSDVAIEAGVARATVYRHFPNRDALIQRLVERAADSASRRLDAERIDDAPIDDAIRRAIRVLVELGDEVVFLNGVWQGRSGGSRAVVERVRHLIERGQGIDAIRSDVPAVWLAEALVSPVVAVTTSELRRGREDTVDHLTRLFLHGAGAAN